MIYPEYLETTELEKMKKKISKIENEFQNACKSMDFYLIFSGYDKGRRRYYK